MDPTGDERREPDLILESGRSISAIGQAEDGAVYLVDLRSGELLRASPSAEAAGGLQVEGRRAGSRGQAIR